MELDSRKNEARADLKQQDIRIEVRLAVVLWASRLTLWPGTVEQGRGPCQ